MKRFIFIPLAIVLSCGQEDVLVGDQWAIIDATFKKNPIHFICLIEPLDENDNKTIGLSFTERGTILLPGIKSFGRTAKWVAEGNKLFFEMDTSELRPKLDPSQVGVKDTIPMAVAIPDTELPDHSELRLLLAIYKSPFYYSISRDTLVMKSESTSIRAVKNKRFKNLFSF